MVCTCGGLGCEKCGLPFNVDDAAELRIPEAPTKKIAGPHDDGPVRDDGDEEVVDTGRAEWNERR